MNVRDITVEKFINNIKCITDICKSFNVKNILTSSIIYTPKIDHDLQCQANQALEQFCLASGFTFIYNNNINSEHLFKELHLLGQGINILANNCINYLNRLSIQGLGTG